MVISEEFLDLVGGYLWRVLNRTSEMTVFSASNGLAGFNLQFFPGKSVI